jgi:hypothetical protein
MTEEEATAASVFAQMDDLAMIFAYLYRIHGLEGFLALLDASGPWTKATLVRAADELMKLDMPALAEAISEAAAKAGEPINPFPKNTPGWRDWNRREHGGYSGFLGGKS